MSQGIPIFALATGGLGQAALAVIRVSGQGTRSALACVIDESESISARNLVLRPFKSAESPHSTIDEVMVVFFDSGKSFTGEESAEIHCHASIVVVDKIFSALKKLGFREALPGEFSERAFLNGKMSLSQAEGLASLIASQSELQYLAARVILNGHLESQLEELRSKILKATALLEAVIDFPDEKDVDGLSLSPAVESAQEVRIILQRLIDSYQTGRVADAGLRVCLVGYPNAGKSTLFNHLLGTHRAIVSAVEGTTRDYIEEKLLLNGHLIRLVDTAGLRKVDEEVESMGVELSLSIAAESDVILFMCSAQSFWREGELQFFKRVKEVVRPGSNLIFIKSQIDQKEGDWSSAPTENWIGLSVKNQQGIGDLKNLLIERMKKTQQDFSTERVVLLKTRHVMLAQEALEHLENFLEFSEKHQGKGEELLAAELMMAARVLASIIGKVENEEVLEAIFRQFCIGK